MIFARKSIIIALLFFVVCALLYSVDEKSLTTANKQSPKELALDSRISSNIAKNKLDTSLSKILGSSVSTTANFKSADPYCEKSLSSQLENAQDFLSRQMLDYQQKVGEWFFQRSPPPLGHREKAASGNFLLGLAQAGLLSGGPEQTVNPSEALENLERAHLMDPTNSAPLLYLSYLQNKLGLAEEEKVTLSKLTQTNHYSSYIAEVKRMIFSSIRNPSDLFHAISIYSQIPIPDYGKKISNYIIQNKLSSLADQILYKEYSRKPQVINTDSFLVETAFARNLLTKISPERKDIPSKEWLKKIMANHDIHIERMPPFTQEATGCDINFYWPAVHDIQNSL